MTTRHLLSLLQLLLLTPAYSATVSVVELGQAGRRVTRLTQNSQQTSSVSAVASFLSAMHEVSHSALDGKKNLSTTARLKAEAGHRRRMQEPGMALVPDMFQKADGGLAVFLVAGESEQELKMMESQPVYSKLVKEKIGGFEIKQTDESLMKSSFSEGVPFISSRVSEDVVLVKVAAVVAEKGNQLQAIAIEVEDASQADQKLASIINGLKKEDGTYVLHVVLDDAVKSRRRLTSANTNQQRNLSESEDGEEDNNNSNDQQDDQDNQNNQDGDNRDGNYGNSSDDNFRSMYEIQYFNVVLWTALGLLTILFYAVLLMINMPLMADTLLFGESAKMVSA